MGVFDVCRDYLIYMKIKVYLHISRFGKKFFFFVVIKYDKWKGKYRKYNMLLINE